MLTDHTALGRRVYEIRERAGVSQAGLATAIGVSQPTLSRIESGDRPLTGSELVLLADALGVRVGTITAAHRIDERVTIAARTDGSLPDMAGLRRHLVAYLELDEYLTNHSIPTA